MIAAILFLCGTAVTEFQALNIAVMTVSDTRTVKSDGSGDLLAERITAAGHCCTARCLVPDDRHILRARVCAWIVDPEVQVVITTGGTGLTGRDTTPEALSPLFDKTIEGFGELFRAMSYKEIGASAMQSRAVAGLAGATLIFSLPGSTGACACAWDGILRYQLDVRCRPCNLVTLLPRFAES